MKKFLSFWASLSLFGNGILQPTNQELYNSIQELKNYRERLRSEIINISQKLRMSQVKIESSLEENPELKTIEATIKTLTTQINKK